MRSNFDELLAELTDVRALVASITPVNSALAGHQDSLVRDYLTVRRRFDYAAFIVALYASFERFVENLVAAYARLVARRMLYAALPEGLIRKHMIKSAEILARGRVGEGRYSGIREIDLVKNLFECLSGANPYALNDVAIVAHDFNLRHSEVNALFAAVGIEQACEHARWADAMLDWFRDLNGLPERPQDGVPLVSIQQRIDDIVERRNQVTHRGGSPEDLLGVEEMTVMSSFIEALADALFAQTVAKYLAGSHIGPGRAAALKLREGPYKNGSVVVVDRPEERLFVGQPIFMLLGPAAGARWGRIVGLQVNDRPTDAIEKDDATVDVGIEVGFKCPADVQLYVLSEDDDAVWSPLEETPAPEAIEATEV